MNERIRELAEQASHQSPDGYPVTIPYSKDFAKKFAQLIVRECVSVIEGMADPEEDSDRYFWAIQNASAKVREHFGVDE